MTMQDYFEKNVARHKARQQKVSSSSPRERSPRGIIQGLAAAGNEAAKIELARWRHRQVAQKEAQRLRRVQREAESVLDVARRQEAEALQQAQGVEPGQQEWIRFSEARQRRIKAEKAFKRVCKALKAVA